MNAGDQAMTAKASIARRLSPLMALALPLALAATPTPAAAQSVSEAETLRRFDIMLMVTSLRCRASADDFQNDFAAFEAHHMRELNNAAAILRRNAAGQGGPAQADRALDKISTTIANTYGSGHPWLGCHDLKVLSQTLALTDGPAPVLEAAAQVLQGDKPYTTQLALGH
jgi:hypothetical protein